MRIEDVYERHDAALVNRLWCDFLLSGGQAGETRILRADGTPLSVEFHARAHVWPGLHLTVLRDVSDRKQADETSWLRGGLAHVLEEGAGSDALERALALCCAAVSWEIATLWRADARARVLRFVCGWAAPDVPARVRLLHALRGVEVRWGEYLVGAVVAAGAARWVEDVAKAVQLVPAINRAAGFRSAVAVPLRDGSGPTGAVALCTRATRPKDKRLMAMLTDALAPLGEALARSSAAPGGAAADGLTRRELEVLRLVADGLSSTRIARLLHISARTVDTHRQNIMSKLGVRTVAGLTKYAVRRRISDPGDGPPGA